MSRCTGCVLVAGAALLLPATPVHAASRPAVAIIQVARSWQRVVTPLAAGAAAGALVSVAIAAFAWRRRQRDLSRRRRTESEAALVDVLIAAAKSDVTTAPHVLAATLHRIADAVGVDDVWLWEFGDERDSEWMSFRLRSGESETFDETDQLPRPLRARVLARTQPAFVVATPLTTGGVGFGGLFWVASERRAVSSFDQLDRFRAFSILVAWDLQRVQRRRTLERSDVLKSAILSSLPACVAVLDRGGTVLAVNECTGSPWTAPPGVNYLDAACEPSGAGVSVVERVRAGVLQVCKGTCQDFEIEYGIGQGADERWFHMKVTAFRREGGGAIVTHTDVTARKRAEALVRESEERFRRLADALPVGIWVSRPDGACTYFNRTWLELTGRPIERELGVGWLESVHPDDREQCMGTYLRAFTARQPFSVEYRIRRHDGEYRWLLDKGIPLYGLDTTFQGYLGGATDFTEQRRAEQALRELSGRLIAAQEDERRRIARDLHDSVGQYLALIAIRLDDLHRLVPPNTEAGAIVDVLVEDCATVGREVHAMSHRLHPAKLEALGLVEAIASQCREMSQHGVFVKFSALDIPSIPPAIALCLFRIVQEALGNVAKHSGADSARVTLMGVGDIIVLRIADSGSGFVPEWRSEGLGLVSIRERAHATGGDVRIRSAPGQGTEIEAHVPVRTASSNAVTQSMDTTLEAPNQSPPLSLLSDGSETSVG